MAEETAAREAAAVAAGLLAYCTVLERPSLIGERATSEIMAAVAMATAADAAAAAARAGSWRRAGRLRWQAATVAAAAG